MKKRCTAQFKLSEIFRRTMPSTVRVKGERPLGTNAIDEFRMRWLPWAQNGRLTVTQRGWPSKWPFCAIPFKVAPSFWFLNINMPIFFVETVFKQSQEDVV